jgi:hypothetical protein
MGAVEARAQPQQPVDDEQQQQQARLAGGAAGSATAASRVRLHKGNMVEYGKWFKKVHPRRKIFVGSDSHFF